MAILSVGVDPSVNYITVFNNKRDQNHTKKQNKTNARALDYQQSKSTC